MKVLISAAIVALAATGVTAGLTAGTASGAGTSQFTLFDATGINTARSYYQPAFSSPANWTTPINYSGGTAYWRLQVVDKPSSLAMKAQVCMWRVNFTVETCSALGTTITDEGTYWYNLGSPGSWWKKNNNWAMTPPDNIRIMLKDNISGLQLQSSACGNYCYPRTDLALHVPITMNSQLIIVAQGSTLTPPASWSGCPTAWSAACTTGGTTGSTGSTTTTKATTTTTKATTTTTKATTTTTTIGGGSTGVTVSIANTQVTEPDTGYVSLPFKVFLNKTSSTAVKVNVSIVPGTATAPSDYGNRGGPIAVTIAPGQISAWVGFPVWGDTVTEANETAFANLSAPTGATIADGQAQGTILNDD
jgi:hypothetical protein